jgi:hypothetical protein
LARVRATKKPQSSKGVSRPWWAARGRTASRICLVHGGGEVGCVLTAERRESGRPAKMALCVLQDAPSGETNTTIKERRDLATARRRHAASRCFPCV